MTKYTCKACGVQQSSTQAVPDSCPICEDDRQNVPSTGQQWLILPEQYNQHDAKWSKVEANVYRLPTSFDVGIGQNAHQIQTQNGNYLWDCVPLISDQWVDEIMKRGGLKAIVISHPHFYANMVCWSAAFGNIPIYIHHHDRHWVQDDADNILFWRGDELHLENDLTVINCGGHFEGSSVLHWRGAADGKGVLFGADTICPVGGADTKNVAFQHSFPNQIPLPARKVAAIAEHMQPYSYDRLYGAFESNILQNADNIVQHSIERYVKALA